MLGAATLPASQADPLTGRSTIRADLPVLGDIHLVSCGGAGVRWAQHEELMQSGLAPVARLP